MTVSIDRHPDSELEEEEASEGESYPLIEEDEGDDYDLAEEEDDDGEVVDVGDTPLVRRRVALADERGEWVKDEAAEAPSEKERRETAELYQAFVRHATSLPRLSEEEERALGRKVRDYGDEDAAKKLVLYNLRLAIKMAHQYRRSWTNIMDLIQEAAAGMAVAAQRWDPDQGTRFGTYAVYWIRAQLTKFLMTHGRVIHTGNTRAGRKLYFRLPQIRRRLLADGKEPTIEAIAEEVGEDPEEVARIVSRLDGREASLQAPIGDGDGGTLGDVIAGDGEDPEAVAGRLEVARLANLLIEGFTKKIQDERDLAIWKEHLIADEPVSLVELGKRFGVSKQRMGQLATRLKRAFRRHIIEELGPHTQLHWLFRDE